MYTCEPYGGTNYDPIIIWTTLIEGLKMMLHVYTQYESSWSHGFRQKDFQKLHFWNIFSDPYDLLMQQTI